MWTESVTEGFGPAQSPRFRAPLYKHVPLAVLIELTGQICLVLLFQRKRSEIKQFGRLNSRLTGPICARTNNLHILRKLESSGHHDWPVKRRNRPLSGCRTAVASTLRLSDYRFNASIKAVSEVGKRQFWGRRVRVLGMSIGWSLLAIRFVFLGGQYPIKLMYSAATGLTKSTYSR